MKTIYLDALGMITSKDKAYCECVLSGSYRYSEFHKGYWHTVLSCTGFSIKEYFNKQLLVNE